MAEKGSIGGSLRAEVLISTLPENVRSLIGLQERSPLPFEVIGRDGHFLTCNGAFSDLIGYSQDELRSMTWTQITPPELYDLGHSMRKQISNGHLSRFETAYIRKDGSHIDVEIFPNRFLDEQGIPQYYYAFVADITDSRKVENALRQSEEKYRLLTETAEDFIYVIDRNLRVVFLNRSGAASIGKTPEEVIGQPLSSIFPQKTVEHFSRNLMAIFNSGRSIRDVHGFNFPNKDFWLHVKLTPILDDKGNVAQVIGISRDITDMKRMEHSLRESEQKHRNIVETANEGIWLLSTEYRTIFANRRMADMLGYTVEEMMGRRVTDFVYPEDIPADITRWEEAIRGERRQTEFRYRKKDGNPIWVQLNDTPYYENGRFVGMLGMFTDITERRRADDALKESRRQADLYVDLMGHDINNMNQIALGYLELAQDMLHLDDVEKEFLDRPMEVLKRSSRLIQNVKKLQKINQGGMVLEIVDLGEVLGDIMKIYSTVPGRRITICSELAPGIRVMASPLLTDVFSNLIDNAIKHSDSPDIKISITMTETFHGKNGYYRIYVDDNGPGIPDSQKERIFNRYGGDTVSLKGSGIGLHLARSLVESYGGHIWVEDRISGEPSKGSRFVVMLPTMKK
jgi:PAS domain S-box-containing protein